jgi:hypothetical protein
MRRDRVRPWQRLAALRAGRRRGTELPLPEHVRPAENLPPLEPPDDDREFAPHPPGPVWDPRPAA